MLNQNDMLESMRDGFETRRKQVQVDLDQCLAEKERIDKANQKFVEKMKKEFEGHATALQAAIKMDPSKSNPR